jgi:hypothetical protein
MVRCSVIQGLSMRRSILPSTCASGFFMRLVVGALSAGILQARWFSGIPAQRGSVSTSLLLLGVCPGRLLSRSSRKFNCAARFTTFIRVLAISLAGTYLVSCTKPLSPVNLPPPGGTVSFPGGTVQIQDNNLRVTYEHYECLMPDKENLRKIVVDTKLQPQVQTGSDKATGIITIIGGIVGILVKLLIGGA